MTWKTKKIDQKIKPKSPILICGLPGIGNVGKISIDLIVDELNAKKFMEFHSPDLPNLVFVNEDNLVERPKIELFYKKIKKQDFLFLVGDVQPTENNESYHFSKKVLETAKELKVKQIITVGGIGLQKQPQKPRLFCTSYSQKNINDFKKGVKINHKLFGIVGPIFGASGLLVGLAKEYKISGIVLLVETYNHPMYIGIKASRTILNFLNKKFLLNIDIKKLDKEVKNLNKQILEGLEGINQSKQENIDTTYIG